VIYACRRAVLSVRFGRGNATPAVAPHSPVARVYPSRARGGFFMPPRCDCSIKERRYIIASWPFRSAVFVQDAASVGRLIVNTLTTLASGISDVRWLGGPREFCAAMVRGMDRDDPHSTWQTKALPPWADCTGTPPALPSQFPRTKTQGVRSRRSDMRLSSGVLQDTPPHEHTPETPAPDRS
jgi:hypothetical protein